MNPKTVPSTFPWHRLCNTDHRTFSFLSLSVQQRFPDACFLGLLPLWRANSPWETCETEVSNIEGSPYCSVLSNEILEKSEILSWFGLLMDVVSSSTEMTLSLSLDSLICGVRVIGQVAKVFAARAELRLTRAFGSGTARQGRSSWEWDVEVTVREQEEGRLMKHENGEDEMWHAHC